MLPEPRKAEVLKEGPPGRSYRCRKQLQPVCCTKWGESRAETPDLALPITLPAASCRCLPLLTPMRRQIEGCKGAWRRKCVRSASQGSKQDSKRQTKLQWGSRWSVISTISRTKRQMRECVQQIHQTKS